MTAYMSCAVSYSRMDDFMHHADGYDALVPSAAKSSSTVFENRLLRVEMRRLAAL